MDRSPMMVLCVDLPVLAATLYLVIGPTVFYIKVVNLPLVLFPTD
jgi:hypothetical protein